MSGSAGIRRLRLVPAAIAIIACVPTEPVPSQEGRLIVEAVIDLGTRRQSIFVRRINAFGSEGVTGARVSITGPNGAEMIAPDSVIFRPGLYLLDPAVYGATMEPGATYTLRVTTAQGEDVGGTTTVPLAAPATPGDAQVFSVSRDTLRLAWPRVPGAKRYHVSIVSEGMRGVAQETYRVFADTTIALPGTTRTLLHDEAFRPSETATVVVTAVDDNFYTYYHQYVDPFAGAPPSRLTGALGVFGSIVPIYRRPFAVIP